MPKRLHEYANLNHWTRKAFRGVYWPFKPALLLGFLLCWVFSHALALEGDPEFLLLEVRLDNTILSGAIPALDNGEDVLLPLGELSRLLTIAIQTRPDMGTASGFVLDASRSFSLNVVDSQVTLSGRTEAVDSRLVVTEPDDLYVAISLLERWLPLDLKVDYSSLSLRIHPREKLPLQSRLERQRRGANPGSAGASGSGFSYNPVSYQWLSMPTVDQTLSWDYRKSSDTPTSDAHYTAFLTGDLAGLEAAAFASVKLPDSDPDLRLTLGRSDPEGNLLGPLRARSFRLGSVASPAVASITSAERGTGVVVSNRPLTRPAQFDSHTFSGDLPPGWDVELYYNGTLVDYRQSDSDGRYEFKDQPLSYGRNDFWLIFNGPLGQRRVEKNSFNLAQSMVLPGETQYNLALNKGSDGRNRATLDLDIGLHPQLTLSTGFTQTPVEGEDRQYTSLGLRTYWQAFSLSGDWVRDMSGGYMLGFGIQSYYNGISINVHRDQLNDFSSNVFTAKSDPLTDRNQLQVSGSLPLGGKFRLPLTATLARDQYLSGQQKDEASLKASGYLLDTALTNTVTWRNIGEEESLYGSLQANRRVRNMSVRTQLSYNLKPDPIMTELNLAASQTLGNAYRLGITANHSFLSSISRYSTSFNKNLGRYGMGLSASYADSGEYTVGAKVFVSMGHNPGNGKWQINAKPKAGGGLIAVTAFLDDNSNGVKDKGEIPLEGVGFTVNGAHHQARTDANGAAYLDNLPVRQYLDVSLDTGTLEDPQWHSVLPGTRVLLRPGRTASLKFPVEATSEIDGTVYLLSNESERGVGDVHLQLLNEDNVVVAEIRTSWDGFYIMPDVSPGIYWLRVNPGQLEQLGWRDSGVREITVEDGGAYVSGMDMWVLGEDYTAMEANLTQDYLPIAGYRTAPWIIAQPGEFFTIQVMAARDEALVQRFIDEHQAAGELAYFESRYQGKPWFSVIYGNFGSHNEASAAIGSLPVPFLAADPWVRSYRSIKALLE